VVFTTAEPFPTLLRRSEIVDAQEILLGAHDTALERIVRKTQEMTTLERRIGQGDTAIAQLLVDAISISVDPSSEYSVVCYRNLLPESQAGSEESGHGGEAGLEPRDAAIKMALVDHAIMIKRCLAMFAHSNNEVLSHRHEELQRCELRVHRRQGFG